jgi:D-alanyl-D-alanine-carboxypeptidase/D-alanyl-D-alanine-endopeptidase
VKNGRRKNPFGPSLTLSQKPHATVAGQQRIALGWLTSGQSPASWRHSGGTGGFRSFAAFSREPAVAVVILSNRSTEGSDANLLDRWGEELLRQLIGEPAER